MLCQVQEVDTVVNQRGNTPALMGQTFSQELGNEQRVSEKTKDIVTLAMSYVMKEVNRDVRE